MYTENPFNIKKNIITNNNNFNNNYNNSDNESRYTDAVNQTIRMDNQLSEE